MTEEQAKFISHLSRSLGKQLPINWETMNRTDASAIIDKLKRERHKSGGNENGPANVSFSREQQVRLGLAAKLMHQKWCGLRWPVFQNRQQFKEEVVDLFSLLGEVEQELARNGGGA